MSKLEDETEEGESRYITSRGGDNRYSYYLKGQLAFTYGITRGSRKGSKRFHYVPRQMHLQVRQYRQLHDCPMSKADHNRLLTDGGKVHM